MREISADFLAIGRIIDLRRNLPSINLQLTNRTVAKGCEMRVFLSMVAAAALVFGVSSTALADGISKNEVSKILSDQGYSVRDFSDNMVAVVVGEYVVLVGVDGADSDISYITFLDNVAASDLGYEFLNNFNNEVKFGRAYIDRDGDVTIQMDRNAAGGVSAENIESDFDVFLLLIGKFLSDLESQAIA